MELKVWVDGVHRVVCGLSLNTSCQDVVIALAQAIGQTGRYVLTLRLRGSERQLVADDCPLQLLAQLGQLSAEVQFLLRRTGSSLSDDSQTSDNRPPLFRQSEPEPLKRKELHKALTFSLGPSTLPKRTKPNRAWSPSPRASPEPRASPVSFLDLHDNIMAAPTSSSKEETFRQILQQQRRLQELEMQLQALERETEVWERSLATGPGLSPVSAEELDELEQQFRQNKAELMHRVDWEKELQAEMDREQEMHRRLDQVTSSMGDQSYHIQELQARSVHLEQDLILHRDRSRAAMPQPDEALGALKDELQHRLQQGGELGATLSETERELRAAEQRLQDKWETIEDLNKELRQCKLQQFIQQTNSLPITDVYLSNAGRHELEEKQVVLNL